MVTLSKKLKNAAQVVIKNDDRIKFLRNIYMDPCYIYATDGHLLYRGWHDLNLKKSTLADLSDAKKGKLTLKECQEEKYLNLFLMPIEGMTIAYIRCISSLLTVGKIWTMRATG